MQKILIASAFALISTGAFANTLSIKDSTSSQGSIIGRESSAATHNGDWVSGNGTSDVDQTTTPGSRADAVHTDQANDPSHGKQK